MKGKSRDPGGPRGSKTRPKQRSFHYCFARFDFLRNSAGSSSSPDDLLFYLRLLMQDRTQQRIVNLDVSVIVDQSELAKFVHEMTAAGSGGADRLRQCFLTNVRTDRLRAAFLSEIREQQQHARKPPLTRIE